MDEGLGAVIGDGSGSWFSMLVLPTKKCESLGIWEYGNIKLEFQSVKLQTGKKQWVPMLVSDVVITNCSLLAVMIPWCLFVVEPGGN